MHCCPTGTIGEDAEDKASKGRLAALQHCPTDTVGEDAGNNASKGRLAAMQWSC